MRNFLWLFLVVAMTACHTRQISRLPTERISIGHGPEDMVVDASGNETRLLISCTRRRDNGPPFGEIVSYTPATGLKDTLKRLGMPDSLFFQPHGIFLDNQADPPILYSISHEHDTGFHPIYLWQVYNDSLVFLDLAYSNLLHSPNALTIGPNEEIYVVNDAGKRGSTMEKIFRLNRADIVRLDKDAAGSWSGKVVAEKLGYPAGINRIGDTIYAGDAVNHLLHIYTIRNRKLVPSGKIDGLKGNDNIRMADGRLYVTGHVKPMKFVGHVRSSENLSPVEVWEIDPRTRKVHSIYYTDGSEISAGSTAIPMNGYLYISQVFEPFILQIRR